MRYVVAVLFSFGFALSSLTACSKAIPTTTTLSERAPLTPSNVDDTEPSINSGGGEMTSGSYKIFGKIGPSPVVLQGPGYRIHTSGDN